MSETSTLKYRTRGNASPQGKQRVFLCCHPDDLEEQLEVIANELLDLYPGAAIWYRDPSESRDAAVSEDDLAQMQLVVVPVTARFLRDSNAARLAELPRAQELNIPVLPILDENALAGEFNRICGDLQCLDRHAQDNDPTALPYRTRLSQFLESVLVGDGLAARVRAAFDAYVFLSYRKRDRAEAQQIMRLIHENPLCRDIAIWYDEFLVPGEGFNQAILDALEKSSVFALVVTPNLLENPNYVMTTEWPAARETGKPAIPIEALPTDPEELAGLYAGLGKSVSAEDRAAVGAHLAEALRDVALEAHAGDPAHDYLIGLAYLMGIDTEIDRARALDLITAAANGGLPEACERLAAMYSNGEGVPRNYRTAIYWQERLIEALKEQGSVNLSLRLNRAFERLSTLKISIDDTDGAIEAQSEALEHATAVVDSGNLDGRFEIASSCTGLGSILLIKGDYSSARTWFDRGRGYLEALLDEEPHEAFSVEVGPDGPKIRTFGGIVDKSLVKQALAACHAYIGQSFQGEGDIASARQRYLRGIELLEQLNKEAGSYAPTGSLSLIYGMLAELELKEGDLAEARRWCARGIEIAEKADEQVGGSNLKYPLISLNATMASICEAGDTLDEARLYREKALSIDEASDIVDRSASARLLAEAARSLEEAGDLAGACEKYEQARAVYEGLLAETEGVEDRIDLSLVCASLTDLYMTLYRYDEAWDRANEAVSEARRAAAETDSRDAHTALALAYDGLAFVHRIEGRQEEALSCYEKAVAEYELIVSDDSSWESSLIAAREAVASLKSELQDLEEKRARWAESLRAEEVFELPEDSAGIACYRELIAHYDALAQKCRDDGSIVMASYWYERELRVLEQLANEGEDDVQDAQALAESRLEELFAPQRAASGRSEGSDSNLEAYSIEALDSLSQEDLETLSDTYCRLGHQYRDAHDYAEAAAWYQRCAEAESVLIGKTGAQGLYEPFDMFVKAGRLYRILGDSVNAYLCFSKAAERIDEIGSSGPADEWLDDEGLHAAFAAVSDEDEEEVREALGDLAPSVLLLDDPTAYEKALACVRRIAEKDPSLRNIRMLAELCYKHAVSTNWLTERREHLGEALEHGRRCLELDGGTRDQLFVDMVELELSAWGGSAPSEKPSKRIAVVFYSLDGNTRTVAERLAEQLGADIFEVKALKPYPTKGPLKILLGGKDATFDRCPKIEPLDFDLSAYDSIAIGTPVWADKVAAPMNTFLKEHDFSGKHLALFVPSASGEAEKCLRDLAAKCAREVERVPILSLKEPAKMDAGALAEQIDGFARQL